MKKTQAKKVLTRDTEEHPDKQAASLQVVATLRRSRSGGMEYLLPKSERKEETIASSIPSKLSAKTLNSSYLTLARMGQVLVLQKSLLGGYEQ